MRLSPTERLILELLRENSRRSLTEIASIAGVSRTTAKYHVDRLVEKGIIRRFTVDVDTTGNHGISESSVRVMLDINIRRNSCKKIYELIKT